MKRRWATARPDLVTSNDECRMPHAACRMPHAACRFGQFWGPGPQSDPNLDFFFWVDLGSLRPPGGPQHDVRPYFGCFDPLPAPSGVGLECKMGENGTENGPNIDFFFRVDLGSVWPPRDPQNDFRPYFGCFDPHFSPHWGGFRVQNRCSVASPYPCAHVPRASS